MQMNRQKLLLLLIVGVVVAIAIFLWTDKSEISDSSNNLQGKIQPPSRGFYLGQSESGAGDIKTFEKAVGQKVALMPPYEIMSGVEEAGEGSLRFDVAAAEKAHKEGYIVWASAYEATPAHKPFTVDNLLAGKYDAEFKTLAGQFRQFGKPMFFATMREVNGLLGEWMGGFGPNGDKDIGWAIQNNKGLAEFNSNNFPNSNLYQGLGKNDVCDGLERAVAAQRYYYNFFVEREGLKFLTFDTMAWAIPTNPQELGLPNSHETKLLKSCDDLELFLSLLKDHSDWISINWYLVRIGGESPIAEYLKYFQTDMNRIRNAKVNKPIIIAELGFCDPNKPEKVTAGLKELLGTAEVKGIVLWGSSVMAMASQDNDPQFPDCLIRPDTAEAKVFKEIMVKNKDYFHSSIAK